MKRTLVFGVLLFAAAVVPATAQTGRSVGGGECSANVYNCADTPNPLPKATTVWIDEMTWMDVRDAIKSGTTTAIISTGGFEPNGPWLVTGKHNYVLRSNCAAIARKLGNALCTPIVKLVPEGGIEPPSSHMVSPNSLSLRENVYRMMLVDMIVSLKAQGFKNIMLIGDSGGNVNGMEWAADSLNRAWGANPVVAHLPQHYSSYSPTGRFLEGKVTEGTSDQLHDDPIITLNMFHTDPATVRWEQRVKVGLATINGFSIADRVKTMELARMVVDFRSDTTVKAILTAIANKGAVAAGRGRAAGGGAPAAGDSAAGRGGRGRAGGADSAAGRGRAAGAGAAGGAVAVAGAGGRGAVDRTGGRGARGGGGGGGRGATASPGMRAGAGWGAAAARPDSMMSMGGGAPAACSIHLRVRRGGRGNPWNCAGTPNPGGAETWSVFMEEISWMGVRDYLKAGKTTVIQPVGGLSSGGPFLTLGNRNVLLRADCDALARKLGNAQCGPTLDITLATAAEMQTPGVMTMSEKTYRDVLIDVIHGYQVHGFVNIVLIGNGAATQATMKSVADSLNAAWKNGSRVLYVPEYFKPAIAPVKVVASVKEDGLTDDPETTVAMMVVDPNSVRHSERLRTRQATVDGVSIADLSRALTQGKAVVDARATRVAALIRQRTAVPPKK